MASWVSSAVSFIADCVASVVVEKFVEKGISFLSRHMLRDDSKVVAEELRRVKTALPQIRAVMGVAEALKMKDPSTREWVQQFRDAVDAADDVLDELEYKKLENMVHNRGEGSSSVSKKRKTCAMPVTADILERLKKAVTMLDEAIDGMEDLLQRAKELGINYLSESQLEVRTNLSRETTSFLAERKVFGREAEKSQIISWLTRETEAPLSSFGIVGVGGLGKTTLAQSVYQELSTTSYFVKTIWVCVSTEFSVKGITANILADLGEGCTGDNPLNVLQQRLGDNIQSKKILLVLDDVWDDEKRGDWEQLIAPLRCAQGGSKILFTTRQKSVADLLASVISTEHDSLALKDLEEKDLRLLFNSYAYHGFNPNEYGDLQAIGDRIVKKLHGNPLAAKMTGSLLNSHIDPIYWRRILNHDSLINLEQANNVMEVLKLSYHNLPVDLQVCFRFCSIFPEDHEFIKEHLIEMWMASGFLGQQSWEQKRPEDIGEDYFNILLRKSFFEFSKTEERGRYVMHDLIHELATNVSEGECCRIGRNDKSLYIPSTVRHVSVHESEIQKVSHLENIRSLVITTCDKEDETHSNFFILPDNIVKKSLRVLKICAFRDCKLQEEVSCLMHLRYLSIFQPMDKYEALFHCILFAPIYKLYHLLLLKIEGDVEEYPGLFYSRIETIEMTNLVCLRYMRLPDFIMKTICGVHMMTSLQELTFYVGRESGHHINELCTLNNLRLLTIFNVENIRTPAEARSANILALENLQSLELQCTPDETNLEKLEEIFDNLKPHQNLMNLVIRNYKGQRFPMWKMEDVPPLNLSTLTLHGCPYLKNLKTLEIYDCPNLEKLPDMPFSLTKFEVSNVDLTSLPKICVQTSTVQLSQKSSLRLVRIEECPILITLNGFLQQGTVVLHGLENLTIRRCENLAHIPMHAFRTCASLKYLEIIDCPKLTCLPCLPLSLVTITIGNTGISTLPEYFQSSDSSGGPSPSSFTSSLKTVYISRCPNLIALNGFLQQDNIEFGTINKIHVDNCENLIRIPKGAFSKFVSLDELFITDCPKLAVVDNRNNLMPCCGELDVPLQEPSSRLTTLTDPHNVNQRSNVASLKINTLYIGQLSLLLIEPLRNLRSVRALFVNDCSRIDTWSEQWLLQNSSTLRELTIFNASTLQSLPATMARLTALESLSISKADLLVDLPDLPASLKYQEIKSSDGADKF